MLCRRPDFLLLRVHETSFVFLKVRRLLDGGIELDEVAVRKGLQVFLVLVSRPAFRFGSEDSGSVCFHRSIHSSGGQDWLTAFPRVLCGRLRPSTILIQRRFRADTHHLVNSLVKILAQNVHRLARLLNFLEFSRRIVLRHKLL